MKGVLQSHPAAWGPIRSPPLWAPPPVAWQRKSQTPWWTLTLLPPPTAPPTPVMLILLTTTRRPWFLLGLALGTTRWTTTSAFSTFVSAVHQRKVLQDRWEKKGLPGKNTSCSCLVVDIYRISVKCLIKLCPVFAILQGIPGEKGEMGPPGPPGQDGLTGAPGPHGGKGLYSNVMCLCSTLARDDQNSSINKKLMLSNLQFWHNIARYILIPKWSQNWINSISKQHTGTL